MITALGFDYGSQRIGVAVGQTLTTTAQPLTTVLVKNQQPDWVTISALIKDWQPQVLVVGVPIQADGSDNEITGAIHQFCEQLRNRYHLPVHTIDETLTSVAATQRIFASPILRRKHAKMIKYLEKGNIDAVAAQIILESWFTECHSIT